MHTDLFISSSSLCAAVVSHSGTRTSACCF